MLRIVIAALWLTTVVASPAWAQLSSRPAADWIPTLESPARIESLKIPETVAALDVQAGDVVADIGSGSGAFLPALSRAAGPSGKVYAEDVDPALVASLKARASAEKLTNVVSVLGGFVDPKLPRRNVDLALISDVLHHVEKREDFLVALSKYIKRGGRVALIEFKPGMGGHKGVAELEVAKEQATEWMRKAGLEPVEDLDLFSEKYFVVYKKR